MEQGEHHPIHELWHFVSSHGGTTEVHYARVVSVEFGGNSDNILGANPRLEGTEPFINGFHCRRDNEISPGYVVVDLLWVKSNAEA